MAALTARRVAPLSPVWQGTIYYIAVDGVNGAKGTVKLNYAVGAPPIYHFAAGFTHHCHRKGGHPGRERCRFSICSISVDV